MSNPDLDSQELDFEDVIAQFEMNLNCSEKENSPLEKGFSESTEEDGYNIVMDMADFEPQLQVLCKALMDHVQSRCRVSKKSGLRNREGDQSPLDSRFVKEVFRGEIKATLTQMQNFRESELEGSALLSSSERSTINAFKRQVRERDEQLIAVKQKLKQAQLVKYRLEHYVTGYKVALNEYEDANELLENEVEELRKQNAALTKRCSDADVKHRRDQHERERLHQTMAKFRQEVVVAHQNALNARTEAKQAKRRAEHLEARAAEAKASSTTVSMRIQELKEIQDQMIATMRGVQDSEDATTARRVLKTLGEQRSRLVGKIANLLTRNRKEDENERQDINQAEGSNASETSEERRTASPNNSSPPASNSSSPPAHSNRQNNDEDGLDRKQRFESFRRFGSELTRMTTFRNSRRTAMANIEKTCEAVERDTQALREVIEMKENELERMEDQLIDAIDYAATLELALQKERQRKKLENRNMRNPALEEAIAEMRSFTTHRKQSTLFDWQSHTVKTEGKKGKSGIEATASAAATAVDGKHGAM